MRVLLMSTYELGHQPLGLASPAAHLMAAGHDVACADLAVEHLDAAAVRQAALVGISVPMHTATRLAMPLAKRIRQLNPRAHICMYGLYAGLNADVLLGEYADAVIGGEIEVPLVALADRLATRGQDGEALPCSITHLGREQARVPRRDLLPPLDRYAKLDDGHRTKLVGYVEASRGCAHQCRHCPIPPVYGGRLRITQADVVLADIRQLAAMGAEHVTFGDPDFLNGVKHSLGIVEALHAEFPHLTYDATIKVEHLLEHRDVLPTLARTGCAFVVSAVEAVDDRVLDELRKGHTAADVEAALRLTREAGLVLRPTFVPFTPWTTLDTYLDLLSFLARHGLADHVDPIQLAIRLLVPRGSLLIEPLAAQGRLGLFDAESLTYVWQHPDPRVDALQQDVAALVERAAATHLDSYAVFDAINAQAHAAAGRSAPDAVVRPPKPSPVPRLTEPWFC